MATPAATDPAPCTPLTIPRNDGGRCRPWPITAKMMVSFKPMMLNAPAVTQVI